MGSIFVSSFPPEKGCLIGPLQPGVPKDDGCADSSLSDLIFKFEVVKVTLHPFALSTVLIVKFKNTPERESGKEEFVE